MSMLNSARLAANMALRPIMAGAKQAVSYYRPMALLGKQVAKEVTSSALSHGLGLKMGVGAGIGALAGGGYAATDPRRNTRSMLKGTLGGAMLGGLAGGAYGMGRAAYGARGSEAMLNLRANATLLGRDMRTAGKNAMSTWGSMANHYTASASYWGGEAVGATRGIANRAMGYGAKAGRATSGWAGRTVGRM